MQRSRPTYRRIGQVRRDILTGQKRVNAEEYSRALVDDAELKVLKVPRERRLGRSGDRLPIPYDRLVVVKPVDKLRSASGGASLMISSSHLVANGVTIIECPEDMTGSTIKA
jgi:hypothetical protein